ncbi:MAG: hypothetical protein K0R90_601 [Oscillospiraceae bacterium]|nr:hypothetical protein [Oscillospiraceae bacterium]
MNNLMMMLANNHTRTQDTSTSIADSVTINHTVNAPCIILKLYGKSVQSGTPTPTVPITINSSNNFDITSNGNTETHISQTLRSLPNGAHDTLIVTTGQLTQNVGILTLNGSESWSQTGGIAGTTREFQVFNNQIKQPPSSGAIVFNGYCSHFPAKSPDASWGTDAIGITYIPDRYIRIRHTSANATAFKAWLASNPVTIVFELATPAVSSITPAQVNTYYPQTIITTTATTKPTLEVTAKVLGV